MDSEIPQADETFLRQNSLGISKMLFKSSLGANPNLPSYLTSLINSRENSHTHLIICIHF